MAYGTADDAASTASTASTSGHRLPGSEASWAPGKAALPESYERLVAQVFGYYAALGDPLNRAHISTLKFSRFLRDCGLLPCDPQGAVSFQVERAAEGGLRRYGPGGRTSISKAPTGSRGERLRVSVSSSPSGPQASAGGYPSKDAAPPGGLQAGGRRASFTVSAHRQGGALRGSDLVSNSPGMGGLRRGSQTSSAPGLPLRYFPAPPLQQVDVDLIFLQATQDARPAAEGNEGISLVQKAGFVYKSEGPSGAGWYPNKKTQRRHHMTAGAFEHALLDIALRVFPGRQPEEGITELCEKILIPLSERLVEVSGVDVSAAAITMADPEMMEVFGRAQPGLEKIFLYYADRVKAPNAPPFWAAECFLRFAADFEITLELAHLPLQRIFHDCVHLEGASGQAPPAGRGGHSSGQAAMSFLSFQLSLVIVAQRLGGATETASAVQRVVLLFHRMNAVTAMSTQERGPSARFSLLSVPALPEDEVASTRTGLAQEGRRQSIAGRTEGTAMTWKHMQTMAQGGVG